MFSFICILSVLTVLTIIRAAVEKEVNDPIYLNSHLGEALAVIKIG